MTEVTVTLTDEQVDCVLRHELTRDHAYLKEWAQERRKGKRPAYAEEDPEEDYAEIRELCLAYERVFEYYGVEVKSFDHLEEGT